MGKAPGKSRGPQGIILLAVMLAVMFVAVNILIGLSMHGI
jgi:hypothetical protein